MSEAINYDVVIIGGGLIGIELAAPHSGSLCTEDRARELAVEGMQRWALTPATGRPNERPSTCCKLG